VSKNYLTSSNLSQPSTPSIIRKYPSSTSLDLNSKSNLPEFPKSVFTQFLEDEKSKEELIRRASENDILHRTKEKEAMAINYGINGSLANSTETIEGTMDTSPIEQDTLTLKRESLYDSTESVDVESLNEKESNNKQSSNLGLNLGISSSNSSNSIPVNNDSLGISTINVDDSNRVKKDANGKKNFNNSSFEYANNYATVSRKGPISEPKRGRSSIKSGKRHASWWSSKSDR